MGPLNDLEFVLSKTAVPVVRKKRRRIMLRRKRSLDPQVVIDYKSPDILRRFITDRGKIIPRRISGATQAQQRKLTLAIKRARFLSLLPYSVAHEQEKGFAGEMQNIAQSYAAAVRTRPTKEGGREGGREGSREPRGDKPEKHQESAE